MIPNAMIPPAASNPWLLSSHRTWGHKGKAFSRDIVTFVQCRWSSGFCSAMSHYCNLTISRFANDQIKVKTSRIRIVLMKSGTSTRHRG
jgi:hypothetical protein